MSSEALSYVDFMSPGSQTTERWVLCPGLSRAEPFSNNEQVIQAELECLLPLDHKLVRWKQPRNARRGEPMVLMKGFSIHGMKEPKHNEDAIHKRRGDSNDDSTPVLKEIEAYPPQFSQRQLWKVFNDGEHCDHIKSL